MQVNARTQLRGDKNSCQKEYVLLVEKREILVEEKYVKKIISYVTFVPLEDLIAQYVGLK